MKHCSWCGNADTVHKVRLHQQHNPYMPADMAARVVTRSDSAQMHSQLVRLATADFEAEAPVEQSADCDSARTMPPVARSVARESLSSIETPIISSARGPTNSVRKLPAAFARTCSAARTSSDNVRVLHGAESTETLVVRHQTRLLNTLPSGERVHHEKAKMSSPMPRLGSLTDLFGRTMVWSGPARPSSVRLEPYSTGGVRATGGEDIQARMPLARQRRGSLRGLC